MGKEADVEALWPDGRREPGRLQLEPPKLIFRGAERRVFEGDALSGVRAEARELILASGARFRLPTSALTWAEAIAHPKGRLDKLGVRPGQRVAVMNLEDAQFEAELAARLGARPTKSDDLDLLFYGADSEGELSHLATLAERLAPRGALWVVSLKGKLARVKDVEVMAAAKRVGLVDSKVCAFSEARTALKFTRRRG
jgi:hypothetical protein